MKGRLILFILIVTILVTGILLSCAPPTSVSTAPSSGRNMTLVGQAGAQAQDIQVWKVIDGYTTCYITVNVQRYEPSAIFCVGK